MSLSEIGFIKMSVRCWFERRHATDEEKYDINEVKGTRGEGASCGTPCHGSHGEK